MKNDKSAGNDGLTKEFLQPFGNKLKHFFSNSIRKSFLTEEHFTKTSSNKTNWKKDRDKGLIKNWHWSQY